MICTLYSHSIGFEKITDIVKEVYPKCILTTTKEDESHIVEIDIKGGFFSSPKKFKITYRQRSAPSYQLPEKNEDPLTVNLKGLYRFVCSLPASNEKIKGLFLHKILTLNAEFSIIQEQGETKELKTLIYRLAQAFDAILFAQPNTVIIKSSGQHFLDKNLQLIIDGAGNCEIDDLDVKIDARYFDGRPDEVTEAQKQRKADSELVLEKRRININRNLPCIEGESETEIRPAREIAIRVSILAVTNMVSFNSISNEEAIEYLKKYALWELVTADEKDFLANPTDERKNHETWKCECIWTLMWALKKVDELEFPDKLCNLQNIAPVDYPMGENKNPNDFVNSITEVRSKTDILDANDLYYRLNWACTDARINNRVIAEVNAGVVYERHYALNWLINYMQQEWDDVSCDT